MYPKELTAALRMAFLCALSRSKSSKQIRIHSFAGTNSAPRSAAWATDGSVISLYVPVVAADLKRTYTTDQIDGCLLHLLVSIP